MPNKNENFIIKWYHCFTNPFYIIRKGLYKNVKRIASGLDGNLLDFGCGAKPYKSCFTKLDSYIGIDIQKSGHDHTDEDIDVYYDGKVIPFEDAYFDNVFSSEVFEHVFNIDEVLAEISRVTKTKGKLLITTPFVWPEHEKPYDFGRYSSFGLTYILEKHGFKVVSIDKTSNFPSSLLQLLAFYFYCLLPKSPFFIYFILHQIFILPLLLLGTVTEKFPKILARNDFYLNNVVLAEKIR